MFFQQLVFEDKQSRRQAVLYNTEQNLVKKPALVLDQAITRRLRQILISMGKDSH